MFLLRHGRRVCAPPKGTDKYGISIRSSANLGDTLLRIGGSERGSVVHGSRELKSKIHG